MGEMRNGHGHTEAEVDAAWDEREAREKAARGDVRVLLDERGEPVVLDERAR